MHKLKRFVVVDPLLCNDIEAALYQLEQTPLKLFLDTPYAEFLELSPLIFEVNRATQELLSTVCANRAGVIFGTTDDVEELGKKLKVMLHADHWLEGHSFVRFYTPISMRAYISHDGFPIPNITAIEIPNYLSDHWEMFELNRVNEIANISITQELEAKFTLYRYAYWLGSLASWREHSSFIELAATCMLNWLVDEKVTQVQLAQYASWLGKETQHLKNIEFRSCFEANGSHLEKYRLAQAWISNHQENTDYVI